MNSVALITGGSRGIGRGIALELAPLGWDLLLNFASNSAAASLTQSDCLKAAEHHGKSIRVEVYQADISQSKARRHLLEFLEQSFGRIDLLVNNAGVAP